MSTSTIRDVAQAAQVSMTTVSRVLNGHPKVGKSIQQRVLQAAEELNYQLRPRKVSSSANPLEQKNVMLLLLGMDRSLASLPVIASMLHGVEAALSQSQANFLLADIPNVNFIPEALRCNQVDGVILKGALQGNLFSSADQDLLDSLRSLPSVWVLGQPEGSWGDVVQVNDVRVGQIAAEYLISKGHRRLAFVSAKPSQVTLQRRQASFTFYAEQAGATVQTYLGEESQWHIPSSAVDHVELIQDLVDRLLANPDRPSAVFAPYDSMAAMIYHALGRRGLSAGKDLSLIGCNHEVSLLTGLHPALTTIEVHAEQIGHRAVDQLAWRMSNMDKVALDTGIQPVLVEGDSVATL